MSTSFDQAFTKHFQAEVHMEYQRTGSKLRNTVRTKGNIVGSSTTFQKVGKGTASTKARHGKVPVMNVDHTPTECNLYDYYAGDWVDTLDELKSNIDERLVIARAGAYALGRKTDELVITELDTSTNYAGDGSDGLTKAKVLTAFEMLGDADVSDDGERYAIVGWKQWSDLLGIDEFANADYVGDGELPWKGTQAKKWLGTLWIPHSGLTLTSSVRYCYWYHKTAIGHAVGKDVKTDVSWHGDVADMTAVGGADTKRIIERHPLTDGLKPARADQWAAGYFTVYRTRELRDPSMQARGIGANVTGSRADVIICDDVEVPRTCATVHLRAELRARLGELEFVRAAGGTQIYVGTPHSYYSIYAREPRPEADEDAPFLGGFQRLEIPLIDSAGQSRWPERYPQTEIEQLRQQTGPNKFASQMMLVPVSDRESRLDPNRLVPYDDELEYREGNGEVFLRIGGRRMLTASCFWDPAYGAPDAGDASVIAVVYTDEDGGYWLHRVTYLTHDPAEIERVDEATQMCRQVAAFAHEYYLPSLNLETNGIGRFLPGLLRREISLGALQCAVIERVSARAKGVRIVEAFDAPLAAGRLHAHRSVWSTPFIAEMRAWRPANTRGPDDGLDAVSGCLLNEPVRLTRAASSDSKNLGAWRPGGRPIKASSEFNI